MKRMLASGLTAPSMGLLIWSGTRRAPAPVPWAAMRMTVPRRPSAVQGLLESASGRRRGLPRRLRRSAPARLEREVNERGPDAFAADLRTAARSRKSHAVFAVEPDGPGSARVTVETVYPDRNERQTYRLEQNGVDWLVTEVETVQSRQPMRSSARRPRTSRPKGCPSRERPSRPAKKPRTMPGGLRSAVIAVVYRVLRWSCSVENVPSMSTATTPILFNGFPGRARGVSR